MFFRFAIYPSDMDRPGQPGYLVWLLFPLVPLLLGHFLPQTIGITSYIKPGSKQVYGKFLLVNLFSSDAAGEPHSAAD